MDEVVSDIITRTTEIDPKTNLLAMFALEAQLDIAVEFGDGYEQITIGSVADLNIKPLLRCDNDINIMSRSTGEIAIPIGCKIPDDEYLSRLNRANVSLYRMQPTQDPRYVCLLTAGSLERVPHINSARYVYKQDPNSGIYVQRHKGVSKLKDFISVESATRRTFQYCSAFKTDSLKVHKLQLIISSDSVKSIPCPNWASNDFCERPRPHDWPTKDIVTEIARNGCDLFLASDVRVRGTTDTPQWRLSFPRAETLLMETWTPEQKIVYHLLRYLRKNCLPVNCLISSYDLKTVMLWNCEKQPISYWKANVITISCDLLNCLIKHINGKYLPNYFIPQSNQFEARTDEGDSFGSRYAAVVATLTPLTRADIFAKWFLVNYIGVAAKQYIGTKSENMAEDLVLIEHLDIAELMSLLTVFVDTFLADYCKQKSMGACMDVNSCIGRLVEFCARGKLDPNSCTHMFDYLPRFDIRSLDFFQSLILMEAANQTHQFGFSLGGDSIGMVIAVLIRSKKINLSKFDHYEAHSSLSYFKIATSLLSSVRYPTGVDDKLLLALSKAYFWKSLLCTDSWNVYCAANAYLAAMFYQGKETKLALHCCTLIASKDEHLSCSKYTIQPKLLPIINTILYDFETEKESKNVSHKTAGKQASIDTLTPEAFASSLFSKIHIEGELHRFYEDEDTGSSCSRMKSRGESDKNISYNEVSNEEAKISFLSSSYIASKKSLLKNESQITGGNISTKTRIYVRTECYDNYCQKFEIVESQYREHYEMILKSDTGLKETVENEPTVVNPKKVGKEMVYCCEQSNLIMNIPFAMQNNVDHKLVAYSNSCWLKSVLYSRKDPDVYPPPEDETVPVVSKLTVKNVSDNYYYETFLEQNSRNTYSDFVNTETISNNCSSREINFNCQYLNDSVETSIRQDVVSALVKASVCQMTAFNKAMQNDPDISEHGDCDHPYMALHHFNSGHFQAALLLCNDILKPGRVRSSDAICFNVICSSPFNHLLTHELKMIVNECRSSSEITTINTRCLAVYLSINCLMNLDRSAVEIARMLMLAYALLLHPHESFEEVNSRIFALLRKSVLQRYRGIITENIGKNFLAVRENGSLTDVGVRYDGKRIELYSEHRCASDKENLFSYVNDNFIF